MPHAIPPGAAVRRDWERLAALTLAALPAPDTAAAAALIPWDHPAQGEALAHALAQGEALALGVRRAGALVGQVFYRLDGDTFRLLGAHALPGLARGEAWATVMPLLEGHARALGCRRIQTDTSRPGVLRAHLAGGFAVAEVVLTKAL